MDLQDLRSNKQVVFSCKYHIIFCPKYRRKILVGAIEKRLKEIIFEVALELQVDVLEMECDQDHIHLLCEVDPQFGVHKFVKAIKGRSSRILRSEFPELKTKLPTLWSHSYFVSTVGGAPLAVGKQYIENQKRSERK
jgi:putative transposase